MPLKNFFNPDWLPVTIKSCLICGHELGAAEAKQFLAFTRTGRDIRTTPVLCEACHTELVPIQGKRCACCGIKLLSESQVCTRCRDRHYAFIAHRAIFLYRGLVKELIYQFKFQKQKTLAGLFAYYLVQTFEQDLAGMLQLPLPANQPVRLPLVPVPASPGRSVEKNSLFPFMAHGAMRQLTSCLAHDYGYEICDCLLCLGKAPQKELDFETRLQNVKGRFAIKPDIQQKSERFTLPEQVVLLDDIFTTGATANECANVLLAAGVRYVYVITLAMD